MLIVQVMQSVKQEESHLAALVAATIEMALGCRMCKTIESEWS